METQKLLFDTRVNVFLRGHGLTFPGGLRAESSDPVPEESLRWARIGFGCFRSPTAGLKPFADGIRNTLPFGLPEVERQHEKESHVVGLIDPETEAVPVSIDIGACGIVRRTGLRPTASRACARAA